jgi:hypothetical protein
MSKHKMQNYPPGALKLPKNPDPQSVYNMILDPDLLQAFAPMDIPLSQYKYACKELEKAGGSKAKKYINLTQKSDKFFIGDKKVISVKDHSEFLRNYYNNPETSMRC